MKTQTSSPLQPALIALLNVLIDEKITNGDNYTALAKIHKNLTESYKISKKA